MANVCLEIESMIRQRIDVIRLSIALSSIVEIIGNAISRIAIIELYRKELN